MIGEPLLPTAKNAKWFSARLTGDFGDWSLMDINGKTRLFGIIGDPVGHSLSPMFQNYFLQQAGINAVYLPFHVRREGLGAAVDGLHALGVEGFNVTVPYKERLPDTILKDGESVKIGAVNTVRREGDRWHATNTDWLGLKSVIEGLNLEASTALIFGAGGTARAALHSLAAIGVQSLYICNRGRPRLDSLLEHARKHYPHLEVAGVRWLGSDVREAAAGSQLIINTTSIGLLPDVAEFPFPLAGSGVGVDAVYRPDGRTLFTRAAGCAGLRSVDGLPMLMAQGAASFSFWHGQDPDLLTALRWVEAKLGREQVLMPGWNDL